jgi:hypothetical protein
MHILEMLPSWNPDTIPNQKTFDCQRAITPYETAGDQPSDDGKQSMVQ